MGYIELLIGIAIIIFFIRHLLILRKKETSFVNSLYRIDTIPGIILGICLVIASIHSLIF